MKISIPVRIATAIAFTRYPSMSPLGRRTLWISQLLATVAISIGILALCGSGATGRLIPLDSSVAMAIPTAIAVTSLGVSIFCTIEYVKRRLNGNRPH